MVRASRLGGESSPNEDVRGELWAPLWDAPATWPEVRRVISEGRLSWQGRQAASSIDAARAVACLGVDRGIHTFVRHQIAQRNGKSYLAGPVGRVQVRRIPGAADLGALDAWVRHARSVGGESVGEAARHLDRAQTAVVDTGGTATAFTEVLVALTDLERAVGRSLSGRERCQPLPPWRGGKPLLDAATWVGLINDGTAEVRLATALASLSSADGPLPSMAAALRGLAGNTGRLSWSEDANGREPDAIAAARSASPPSEVLRRRLFTADQVHPGDLHQLRLAAYRSGLWASLEDIVALTSGRVDFARMMRLARGMAMLAGWDARKISTILRRDPDPSHSPSVVDPWFAAVRLCLLDSPFQPSRAVGETKAAVHPLPRRSWGRLLVAGRFEEVGCEALSILARRGITSLRRASPAGSLEPSVAAVALLLRLSPHDVGRLSTTISDPTPQGQ